MLLQGLMADLNPDKSRYLQYQQGAVDILEGVRKKWPSAPTEGAESILKDTFIRVVRRLWCKAYQSVSCATNRLTSDLDYRRSLEMPS